MVLSGQQAQMTSHGSCWGQASGACSQEAVLPEQPSPAIRTASFLAMDDQEAEVAKTLILMEFADVGSLDQYAVRTSFKRNLVGDNAVLVCLACCS